MTTIEQEGAMEVRRARPMDIEALLLSAMQKGPDVVERMMVVRRELNAERAKAECDDAVRQFQQKCPRIGKTKGVPDKFGNVAYRYTPLEEIINVIGPILAECGLSYSFDTDVNSQPNWVISVCEITHVSGHSFRRQAKFPLGTKTGIMSDTQQYSAALSFANRRVLCNALGIVTVGEDQDGQDAWRAKQHGPTNKADKAKSEPDPMKDAKAKLWALLEPVRGPDWNSAATWLRARKIIGPAQAVSKLTLEEIGEVFDKASIEIGQMRGEL